MNQKRAMNFSLGYAVKKKNRNYIIEIMVFFKLIINDFLIDIIILYLGHTPHLPHL